MNSKVILCVDNDSNWVSNLKFQSNNNVVVEHVPTMLEAMQILKSSANVYYCVVINYANIMQDTDVSVLIDEIKEKVRYAKVVFSLDENDQRKISSVRLTHANGYVVKPYSIEDVLIQCEQKVNYSPINESAPNIKINGLSNMGVPQKNSFQNQRGSANMSNMGGINQQGNNNGMPNMRNGNSNQQGMPNMSHMNQMPNQGMSQQGNNNGMPNMRNGNQNQQGMQGMNNMNQMPNQGMNQQGNNDGMPNMRNGNPNQQGMQGMNNMNQMPNQGMNQQGNNNGMPNMNNMGMNSMGINQHQNMNSRNAIRIPRNTIISVHCPKGGVGKSSISKELASIYAQCSVNGEKLRVCLVDMDLDYGDAAIMFGLKQNKSISDWARAVREQWLIKGDNSSEVVFSYDQIDACYLLTHQSGLKILAAPKNHKDSALMSAEMVTTIVNNLRSLFDVVILDTGNGVKEFTVRSLEMADKILMVCNSDLTTINEILTLKKTLEQIQYPMHKISLLMNEVVKGEESFGDETSSYLNIGLIGKLPKTVQLKQANNNCQVLSLGPETPFTMELRRVANTIVPVVKKGNVSGSKRGMPKNNGEKKPGFFSRLFKK